MRENREVPWLPAVSTDAPSWMVRGVVDRHREALDAADEATASPLRRQALHRLDEPPDVDEMGEVLLRRLYGDFVPVGARLCRSTDPGVTGGTLVSVLTPALTLGVAQRDRWTQLTPKVQQTRSLPLKPTPGLKPKAFITSHRGTAAIARAPLMRGAANTVPQTKRISGPNVTADARPAKNKPGTDDSNDLLSRGQVSDRASFPRSSGASRSSYSTLTR